MVEQRESDRIRLTRNDVWHHRSVHHSQAFNAAQNSQLAVDHCSWIAQIAHLAGADWMIDRPGESSSDAFQVEVAEESEMVATWQRHLEESRIEQLSEGLRVADFDGHFHALHDCGDIVGMAQVSRIDQRLLIRISRVQLELAATFGPQQDRIDRKARSVHVVFVVWPDLSIAEASLESALKPAIEEHLY